MKTQTNWEEINQKAFEYSMRPVALPERDGIPYWNAHARGFIMPPSFDVAPLAGAVSYRFTLLNSQGEKLAVFESENPHEPLTRVWGSVPVGKVKLNIEALDKNGSVIKNLFQREFARHAWFHGPYPSVSHDYRAAALRCYSYIYHIPHIQAWLDQGTVDEKIYRKYCYPSKILSAIADALFKYSQIMQDPDIREKTLKISCRMADWLIENSCPAGTPLEYLPPTYWKYATYPLAKRNIGQIMMTYPMGVGNLYLKIYRETGLQKYLDAAIRLAGTMKKLELPAGSWYLKYDEKTGKPLGENIVLITQGMNNFLTGLSQITGNKVYAEMCDRAYRRLLEYNLKMWDWDGQFEDVIPTERYVNLTKGHAQELAANLFREGKTGIARAIVEWTEDQFVMWSGENPWMKEEIISPVLPTAVEQYNCYSPVDASMGNFISIWTKAYHYTGDPVYLEKAKAIADAVLRNQREDGSIPTWFCKNDLPDWLNCMNYTAGTLIELSEEINSALGKK